MRRDVGAHDVAHVGEVALRVEVADLDHRLDEPRLDQRDLPRHARRRERGALPRAGVVERTRDDDVDAVLARGAQRELLLRELAHRVRIGRADRTLFRDRRGRWRVDGRRAGHEHAARRAGAPQRVEQMMRARARSLESGVAVSRHECATCGAPAQWIDGRRLDARRSRRAPRAGSSRSTRCHVASGATSSGGDLPMRPPDDVVATGERARRDGCRRSRPRRSRGLRHRQRRVFGTAPGSTP